MDYITIKDLEIYSNHGIHDFEKKSVQKFLISVNIGLDTYRSATENNLDLSINYSKLSKSIYKYFTENNFDLLEQIAEETAKYIFSKYSFVSSVEVKVKKPWAPIGLSMKYPMVSISRVKKRAVLSIGTNMGDCRENLKKARELLEEKGFKIVKLSGEIITKPWGKTDQSDFLNQALEIEYFISDNDLLFELQNIEKVMGRVRKEKWGERIIDLDIIYIGNQVIHTDNLVVPHPFRRVREFVLAPIAEIMPYFIDPVYNKTVEELLDELKM